MSTDTGGLPWEGSARYSRAEGVILRSIAGESLLIPISKELADLREIFTLTPVGVRIWEQLDGSMSLDGVLSTILERYDVPEDEALADLSSFIARLIGARLIERQA